MRHHDVPPRLIALVAILAGCGTRTPLSDGDAGAARTCAPTEPITPRACLGPASGAMPGVDVNLSIDAIVSGRSSGPSCFGFAQPGAATARFALLGLDGQSYTLDIESAADALPSLSAGENVRVEYRRRNQLFAVSPEHLTISDARGARAHFATGFSLAALPLIEGVTVARGSLFCSISDTCSTTERYAVRVAEGGRIEDVQAGTPTDVGGFRVFHAGVVEATSTGKCTDCCTGSVSLALLRR